MKEIRSKKVYFENLEFKNQLTSSFIHNRANVMVFIMVEF